MPISTITSNSLTPTSDLTINGLTVGKGTGGVATNTSLGNSALNANTTGDENVAVGASAMLSNTTGNAQVAVGRNALSLNTTGAENTAVGRTTLFSNTTGSLNSGMGRGVLQNNISGSNNTGSGAFALFSNTSASNNTAVGYQAGYTGTHSGFNSYLGYRAGYTANFGSSANTYNTFLGAYAGSDITTGAKNVIIGGYSGNLFDLDLRTASSRIVLSDGDGNPKIYMSNDGVTRLFNAYQNTLTSNSKGGTVTILPRDVFFPPSYFNVIDTCTIIVNCVASEGTGGGYTRTDILHVNYRFGYNLTSLASNASDGISVSNWTYSFDSNGLRVTQNWGASGGSLGTRWTFFITGCLFQG